MRRPVLVIALLAAAASFFGWETYRAWTAADGPTDAPAADFAASPRPGTAADGPSRDGDLTVQVAAIVTKPLFRPDRQPFHENAPVAGRNYAAELARFSLVGVLLQGDTRTGVVVSAAGGRHERWEVGAGDSIPGFAVKEVQTDGLALSADGKEFFLPLYAGGPKGQASGSVRTEVPQGLPGAQPPAAPRMPSPSPNVAVPGAQPSIPGFPGTVLPAPNAGPPGAARPPAPGVAPPSPAPVPPPPVLTNEGMKGFPRQRRSYPINR